MKSFVLRLWILQMCSVLIGAQNVQSPVQQDQQRKPSPTRESEAAQDMQPSLEETIDYIVQHVSGIRSLQVSYEQDTQHCGGNGRGILRSDNRSYTLEREGRSINVMEEVALLRDTPDDYTCSFRCPADGMNYSFTFSKSKYKYLLPLRDIALDGVGISPQKDDDGGEIYVLAMRLTRESVEQSSYEAQFGLPGKSTCAYTKSEGSVKYGRIEFWIRDSDTAERLKKAFIHAATLSGAKKELF